MAGRVVEVSFAWQYDDDGFGEYSDEELVEQFNETVDFHDLALADVTITKVE
jgi:hypothetical protein